MSHFNQENMDNMDNINLANSEDIKNGRGMVEYFVGKLQEAMGNPLLQADVQSKLQALQQFKEGVVEGPLRATDTRGISKGHERERNEGPSRRHEETRRHELSKESDGSDTSTNSDSDVAPRRKRDKRSQSPPKRKRPSRTSQPKRKRRKRSPSSSPSSSSS